MSILAGLVLCVALQDPDARYREALFHEVDAGDLQKAIDAYQAIESDAAAPEPVRAKAAFRRAWCLEKKGRRADAERGYRDVAAKYPGQAETVEKAKERLDRLASPPPPVPPVSQEQRIADLVLSLGSPTREIWYSARQTLVLIGDPAVPALQKGMLHKDVDLSTTAACALVQMEKDEGTYAPLLRGLLEEDPRKGSRDAADFLDKLLKRQPAQAREFVEAFKKEKDPAALSKFLQVLKSSAMPEARSRLVELFLEAPLSEPPLFGGFGRARYGLAELAVRILQVSTEEQLFDLLSRLEKLKDGPERARLLLDNSKVKVTRVREFGRHIAVLFPGTHDLDLPSSLEKLDYELDIGLLQECGAIWLRSPTGNGRTIVSRWLSNLHLRRFPAVLTLLEEKLGDEDRYWLLDNCSDEPPPPDEEARKAVGKALWAAFDREKAGLKDVAVEGLLRLAPESHPRWMELIAWEMAQPFYRRGLQRPARSPTTTFCDIPSFYEEKFTKEAQERVRKTVYKQLAEGDEEARRRALYVSSMFGVNDEERFSVLSNVALDATVNPDLRAEAVGEMWDWNMSYPQLRKSLPELLKDKSVVLRKKVVVSLVKSLEPSRDPELEGILAPLVGDLDPEVSWRAAEYLAQRPRPEHFEPLVRALKSPHVSTRGAGAIGLGALETVNAVPHLIEALDDPERTVREHARGALERIRKRHEEKAQWLEWYERVKPK